ncbi:hypothetical protein AG1IA_06429 [Rhizoctonia solani AG-1 IA]|uniref:Uncharacterized protein n=1 Tax=Thanatephorus cucumeris (strain AG1-IA) TaxID=983506 RepID=L8WS21_THACA|nr:hypothetical protein AG1IA_06429 [Rhizoctonia solani AG-1 IA]
MSLRAWILFDRNGLAFCCASGTIGCIVIFQLDVSRMTIIPNPVPDLITGCLTILPRRVTLVPYLIGLSLDTGIFLATLYRTRMLNRGGVRLPIIQCLMRDYLIALHSTLCNRILLSLRVFNEELKSSVAPSSSERTGSTTVHDTEWQVAENENDESMRATTCVGIDDCERQSISVELQDTRSVPEFAPAGQVVIEIILCPLLLVGHETQTGEVWGTPAATKQRGWTGSTRPRVWLVGGRPKPVLVTYGMVGGIKTTRKGVPRHSVCARPDGRGGRTYSRRVPAGVEWAHDDWCAYLPKKIRQEHRVDTEGCYIYGLGAFIETSGKHDWEGAGNNISGRRCRYSTSDSPSAHTKPDAANLFHPARGDIVKEVLSSINHVILIPGGAKVAVSWVSGLHSTMPPYVARRVCSPPDLPPYLKNIHELKPIDDIPSDEEFMGIHALIRMASRVVDVPDMGDPVLLARLSEHLFNAQMGGSRSLYTFQLEPVIGAPSEEEIIKAELELDRTQLSQCLTLAQTWSCHSICSISKWASCFDFWNDVPNEASVKKPKQSIVQVEENAHTNNVGSGANVIELNRSTHVVHDSGFRVEDVIERSNQLVEQTNQLVERSNQLIERSNQITQVSNRLLERYSQATEWPDKTPEKHNEVLERLNGHLEKANQVAVESTKPTERLGDILETINKVLNGKGNSRFALDSLINEKGDTLCKNTGGALLTRWIRDIYSGASGIYSVMRDTTNRLFRYSSMGLWKNFPSLNVYLDQYFVIMALVEIYATQGQKSS